MYNNGVLVGNWVEERLKNEDDFKFFLRKRDRRELLLQKARTLYSNLLKERPLSISGNYAMFGYNVQLIAPDIPVKGAGGVQHHGLALSSQVGGREVDCEQNIYDGCLMTLSPLMTPCCRNTFVILSIEDESIRGKKVNYGDQFFLKAENYGDPDAPPLYVRYQNCVVPEPSNRIPIRLSAKRDTNCRWTTVPLLPCDRLEGIGKPIETGKKLIIKNCVADKSLSVMYQNWMQTFFGMYKLDTFRNQMKNGDMMLARYRKMTENLNAATVLTQSTGTTTFGAKISLLAPHVSVSDTPSVEYKGLFLGGRISADDIMYSQDLRDGCSVVAHQDVVPQEKHTFVITSADYCNREHEVLKFNQEFLLTLSKTVKTKPLYVRFDPNAIPGLCGKFPLFLSEHAVSSTRWRILPAQRPNISRFEQEGKPVPVNEDIIINHCATNINLGVDTGKWETGFYGKIYAPLMKTCLDVFGRELPNNVWHIHIPISKD
ncbi:cilia- and flagella-associated protein 161 [Cydia strobilella]|uniref:cilia- and flagella-associated protein 161 n=1 Tax=Cydia strobilella TaxID=1100964 RepID=UPI003007ED07